MQEFITNDTADQDSDSSLSDDDTDTAEGDDNDEFGQWALSDSDEAEGPTDGTSGTNDACVKSSARITWLSSRSKLEAAFVSLELAVECLYKLPVRQTATFNRVGHLQARASKGSEIYAHFDKLYVRDAFPNANTKVAIRLGLLITQRRRILRYSEAYNEELQKESSQSASAQRQREVERSAEPSVHPPPSSILDARSEMATHTLPKPSLRATTYRPDRVALLEAADLLAGAHVDMDEVSSIALTTIEQNHLDIPDPPKDSTGRIMQAFRCPYYGLPIHVTTTHAWRYVRFDRYFTSLT